MIQVSFHMCGSFFIYRGLCPYMEVSYEYIIASLSTSCVFKKSV